MSSSNLSEFYLICNFVAYLLVAFYFFYKDHFRFDVKNAGFFWLAFSALSSYLFYIQPGFSRTIHYSVMTVEPFLYLFPCLIILYLPLRRIDTATVSRDIKLLSRRKIDLLAKVSFLWLLFLLIAYTYQTMNTSLVDMGDIRQDLYNGYLKNPFFSSWLGSSAGRLFNQTRVLLYCISFYCLICYERKNFFTWFFIVVPYIIGFEHAYCTATRSAIFFIIMIVILQFFLYRNLIDEKYQRVFKITLIGVASVAACLLVLMSTARFTDNSGLFYYKYAGESMINFNGLLFNRIHGTTDGMAYFWYIPQKLGFYDMPFDDLLAKWSYMESKTGVSGQFFYTIAGALIFEFGKVTTYFIIFGLAVFEWYIFSKKINATMLILTSWILYQLVNMVFYLPLQGDAGVLSCLWLFLFCKYMKLKRIF